MAAAQAIKVVHDTLTVFVRDTLLVREHITVPYPGTVRIAQGTPAWVTPAVTVATAVVAAILAQGLRVLVDDNRLRERVRQVLMQEVVVLTIYLRDILGPAEAWQLPDTLHFWSRFDQAMEGYDSVRTEVHLLPVGAETLATPFFLRAKRLRHSAEKLAQDCNRDRPQGVLPEHLVRHYTEAFNRLTIDALELMLIGEDLYRALFDAAPKAIARLGASVRHQAKTLQEAERIGRGSGVVDHSGQGGPKPQSPPPQTPPSP